MKLYVWENVLCDYTCGMIIALAPDMETALSLARDHPDSYDWDLREMGAVLPTVIDLAGEIKPQLWRVSGGG